MQAPPFAAISFQPAPGQAIDWPHRCAVATSGAPALFLLLLSGRNRVTTRILPTVIGDVEAATQAGSVAY